MQQPCLGSTLIIASTGYFLPTRPKFES